MLCRHFETTKGCMHGDKCQFAHGIEDLSSSSNVNLRNFNISNLEETLMEI